ncbi:MAG: glycosyl hydrolase, partial [Verrucomicrobiales bacterium VVV1]
RSTEVPEVKWAMQGYQADIDGKDQWSGQNYEERGRQFLAYRGQSVILKPGSKPEIARVLGDRAELQKKVLKEDWNQVHLIAKGNHLQHFTNGVLMAEVIDDDPEKRRLKGLLGVQVHVGPPMKIEYRKILLKKL